MMKAMMLAHLESRLTVLALELLMRMQTVMMQAGVLRGERSSGASFLRAFRWRRSQSGSQLTSSVVSSTCGGMHRMAGWWALSKRSLINLRRGFTRSSTTVSNGLMVGITTNLIWITT
jgi:hypothetical protein